jgi:hypothetical protein
MEIFGQVEKQLKGDRHYTYWSRIHAASLLCFDSFDAAAREGSPHNDELPAKINIATLQAA